MVYKKHDIFKKMSRSHRFLGMGISSWVHFAFLSAMTKLFRADLDPLSLVVPWIGTHAAIVGFYLFYRGGWEGMKTRIWKVHLFWGILVSPLFL